MKDKFKTYDINDKFNQMVYMIKAKEGDENMETIKQMNPMVEEITKKVRKLTEDEMAQIEMWRQEEQERAYRSDMACAREEGEEIGIRKGLERGIKQGKQEGIIVGIKQGVEQGKKEGKREGKREGLKEATKQIIQNMYENKFDMLQIALAVNLSKEEVMKILEKNRIES